MHIHILGVCGTFMAGIAAIAKQCGHTVTGSDQNVYPPMSSQLENLGISLHHGIDEKQADLFLPDVFVVGNVMTRGMPIIERILRDKLSMISGPKWLYQNVLSKQNTVLCVSGTHGKTTTTALAAWILDDNNYNPGFLIGGAPGNFDISARIGDGRIFVIEADEYDTAFFDKRSKFIHYHPNILILNNLEFDHADIFTSLGEIEKQFHHLIKLIPDNGQIIANCDDHNLKHLLTKGVWSNLEYFGTQFCEWRIDQIDALNFKLNHLDDIYHPATVIPGVHNQFNMTAAIAACHKCGVSITDAINSSCRFKPPKRRLEMKFQNESLSVFDDFAHHPTSIKQTIHAVKSSHHKHLIVVFEPRSNSMRSGAHNEGLKTAFSQADEIILYQDMNHPTSLEFLQSQYTEHLWVYSEIEKIIEHLHRSTIKNPDTDVIFMSNGEFKNIVNRYLCTLQ